MAASKQYPSDVNGLTSVLELVVEVMKVLAGLIGFDFNKDEEASKGRFIGFVMTHVAGAEQGQENRSLIESSIAFGLRLAGALESRALEYMKDHETRFSRRMGEIASIHLKTSQAALKEYDEHQLRIVTALSSSTATLKNKVWAHNNLTLFLNGLQVEACKAAADDAREEVRNRTKDSIPRARELLKELIPLAA